MNHEEILIKIDSVWFDVTNFNTHPGGKKILKKYHLQDATKIFNGISGHQDSFTLDLLWNFELKDKDKVKWLNEKNQTS